MKIAIAQTRPAKGDIEKNIQSHKHFIGLAVGNNAGMIFFPELSITSYQSMLAKELATTQNDTRFDDFQQLSDANNITICIGVPTIGNGGTLISMIIFQPNDERLTYSKQLLHEDELPYFINRVYVSLISGYLNEVLSTLKLCKAAQIANTL
jgi:predicted amidohydrolase